MSRSAGFQAAGLPGWPAPVRADQRPLACPQASLVALVLSSDDSLAGAAVAMSGLSPDQLIADRAKSARATLAEYV